MPWVKIGRYRFDLDEVALVADVVGDEVDERIRALKGGVTVTLHGSLSFELLGEDAEVFTATFDQHVASREIGRAPPDSAGPLRSRPVVEPTAVVPRAPVAKPGNTHG